MARRRFRDPQMTCIKIDKSLPASIALLDKLFHFFRTSIYKYRRIYVELQLII